MENINKLAAVVREKTNAVSVAEKELESLKDESKKALDAYDTALLEMMEEDDIFIADKETDTAIRRIHSSMEDYGFVRVEAGLDAKCRGLFSMMDWPDEECIAYLPLDAWYALRVENILADADGEEKDVSSAASEIVTDSFTGTDKKWDYGSPCQTEDCYYLGNSDRVSGGCIYCYELPDFAYASGFVVCDVDHDNQCYKFMRKYNDYVDGIEKAYYLYDNMRKKRRGSADEDEGKDLKRVKQSDE